MGVRLLERLAGVSSTPLPGVRTKHNSSPTTPDRARPARFASENGSNVRRTERARSPVMAPEASVIALGVPVKAWEASAMASEAAVVAMRAAVKASLASVIARDVPVMTS